MTTYMTRIGMAGLGVLLLAAPLCAEEQQVLRSRTDKDSYSTGVDIVRSLKQRGGQIDLDLVIRGMKDGLIGDTMLMSEDELRKTMAAREAEAAKKRDQAASQREDTQSKTASAAPATEPAVQQKQERPERQNEQGEGPLATATSGVIAGTMPSGKAGAAVDPGTVQPRSMPEQRSGQSEQPAQSGPFLSRRNQAKLGVADLKRELRAAPGGSGQ